MESKKMWGIKVPYMADGVYKRYKQMAIQLKYRENIGCFV